MPEVVENVAEEVAEKIVEVKVLDPKIKAAWFGAGLLIGFAAYKFAVPKIKALMVKPAETVEKAE